MKNKYHNIDLSQYNFLVTGGAGFIGSNLVEYLITWGAKHVKVLDNLSTGSVDNINEFIGLPQFEFIQGDIRDLHICNKSCENVDYVFHEAALGSVPRSINDPITTNEVNINGFLNMLIAVKDCGVKRMVYAASSSTYGDSDKLPKVEEIIGKPLSPYAVTKYVNELYADVFHRIYGIQTIGLRYFNVFGPKQKMDGAYAAVIPQFINSFLCGTEIVINGDGNHTRDFTFIENVIQANILAIDTDQPDAINQVYNVAYGEKISLNILVDIIKTCIENKELIFDNVVVKYGPARNGDVLNSLASILKAQKNLNYQPAYDIKAGMKITTQWYLKQKKNLEYS